MIKGRAEGIGDEAERVEEVALAGAVWADEERQRAERHVTTCDAPVVPDDDAREA